MNVVLFLAALGLLALVFGGGWLVLAGLMWLRGAGPALTDLGTVVLGTLAGLVVSLVAVLALSWSLGRSR